MWFEVKVKYYAVGEAGAQEKRSEIWIVEAVSRTQAEARAVFHLRGFTGVEVTSVKACSAAVSDSENGYDGIYCAKITYCVINERNGKERSPIISYLYPADDIQSALKKAEGIGGGDMSEIVSVSLSKYAGFIPYAPAE